MTPPKNQARPMLPALADEPPERHAHEDRPELTPEEEEGLVHAIASYRRDGGVDGAKALARLERLLDR